MTFCYIQTVPNNPSFRTNPRIRYNPSKFLKSFSFSIRNNQSEGRCLQDETKWMEGHPRIVPGGVTGEPCLAVCAESVKCRVKTVPVFCPRDTRPAGDDRYRGHRGRIVLPHFANFHCFSAARFADVITELRRGSDGAEPRPKLLEQCVPSVPRPSGLRG